VPRTAPGAADNETVAQYTVGLGMVMWKMDLFGRIGSLKTRALEQYLATGLAQSAAQISLIAAVFRDAIEAGEASALS
jgi:multidrug efflux system outer membrane protein